MPQQETYLDQQLRGRRVQIVKVYDEQFAREAFYAMDAAARAHLWKSLDIDMNYDTGEIPSDERVRADLLLDEMLDAGREDWNSFSYFVVREVNEGASTTVYVSPDWPSAESYALGRVPANQ